VRYALCLNSNFFAYFEFLRVLRGFSFANFAVKGSRTWAELKTVYSLSFFPRTARTSSGSRGKIAEYFSHNL
jgi:hypothetical protein